MHPEAAVGVDVFEASGAEDFFDAFDGAGDVVGGFDDGGFDVDDAEADADGGLDVFHGGEFFLAAAGHFEEDVIDVECVDEVDELGVGALLDDLAAVVSEAHVEGGFVGGDVEDAIERFGGPLAVGGVAGENFLIDLDDFGIDFAELRGEDVGKCPGQAFLGFVMFIEEDAAEHVGAGDGEFEGAGGEGAARWKSRSRLRLPSPIWPSTTPAARLRKRRWVSSANFFSSGRLTMARTLVRERMK